MAARQKAEMRREVCDDGNVPGGSLPKEKAGGRVVAGRRAEIEK